MRPSNSARYLPQLRSEGPHLSLPARHADSRRARRGYRIRVCRQGVDLSGRQDPSRPVLVLTGRRPGCRRRRSPPSASTSPRPDRGRSPVRSGSATGSGRRVLSRKSSAGDGNPSRAWTPASGRDWGGRSTSAYQGGFVFLGCSERHASAGLQQQSSATSLRPVTVCVLQAPVRGRWIPTARTCSSGSPPASRCGHPGQSWRRVRNPAPGCDW